MESQSAESAWRSRASDPMFAARLQTPRNDMAADLKRIAAMISTEIGARPEQAAAAIGLLDEGSTVPFIARYRKEATGGLDDTQLRLLGGRPLYPPELHA